MDKTILVFGFGALVGGFGGFFGSGGCSMIGFIIVLIVGIGFIIWGIIKEDPEKKRIKREEGKEAIYNFDMLRLYIQYGYMDQLIDGKTEFSKIFGKTESVLKGLQGWETNRTTMKEISKMRFIAEGKIKKSNNNELDKRTINRICGHEIRKMIKILNDRSDKLNEEYISH